MTRREGELLRVGALARRAGLTPKAVRHYDRIGLLRPAVVDEAGYRWYSPDQIDTAQRVALLREVDVPLDEVRRYLADASTLTDVLETHRRRLDARLARVRGQRHRLDHLITDGLEHPMPDTDITVADERRLAIALFNATWTYMEKENRTREDDDAMLHMAHASRHHWGQVGTAANFARGEWQCSRVYAVLGRGEPAVHHAQRCLDICLENGIADWDLAFAYEALARGNAVAGDAVLARSFTEQALSAAEDIASDDDRELVLSDLETIPGQARFW
jgi:DNA-binding transcriptional MerR regulator